MVTFAEAKARVLGSTRHVPRGDGFEDGTSWLVSIDTTRVDVPAVLVDKETGELTELVVVDNLTRLSAMRPVDEVAFHLPGRHDQQRHAGGRGRARPDPDDPDERAAWQERMRAAEDLRTLLASDGDPDGVGEEIATELWEFYHEGDGGEWGADPVTIGTGIDFVHVGYGTMEVRGSIYDGDGNDVGRFTRIIGQREGGELYVNHTNLQLEPSVQGQGFSEAWNAHAEQGYVANGIAEVTLHANIDVGGYAWAKQGYDWDHPRDAGELNMGVQNVRTRLDGLVNLGSADDNAEYEYADDQLSEASSMLDRLTGPVDADAYPTPYEVAMTGYREGEVIWPGKEVMLNSSWHGRKRLLTREGDRLSAGPDVVFHLPGRHDQQSHAGGRRRARLATMTPPYSPADEAAAPRDLKDKLLERRLTLDEHLPGGKVSEQVAAGAGAILAGRDPDQVYLATQPAQLDGILRDGRVSTAFERAPSREGPYMEHRLWVEDRLLGVAPDVPDRERPIYGFMLAGDPGDPTENITANYGPVWLKVKPDVARERGTMTVGDSLDDALVPFPIDGPVAPERVMHGSNWLTVKDAAQGRLDPSSWASGTTYVEVQIDGGVDLADLDRVVIDNAWGELDENQVESLRARLTERGVPVEVRR